MANGVSIDDRVLSDLVEFYNEHNQYKIGMKEALMLCQLGKRLMADLWSLHSPEYEEEVINFYRICPYGPFELAFANANQGNSRFRKSVVALSSGTVLDYGGGDGSLSLEIAQNGAKVTYVDVESVNMEFAKWRFKKAGTNIKVFDALKDQELIWKTQYDSIICIEIIEHLTDPEKLIRKVAAALKQRGKLIITRLACPGPTPDLPLHFKLPFDGKMLLTAQGLQETLNAFEGDRTLWLKPP